MSAILYDCACDRPLSQASTLVSMPVAYRSCAVDHCLPSIACHISERFCHTGDIVILLREAEV